MAYLTRRFQKIMRKHGGHMKKGNLDKATNSNDLCHKFGKSIHFIRNWHKVEHKEYVKSGGDNDKRRDQVVNKSSKRETTDYVVKKASAIWGNTSSNSNYSEYPHGTSMFVVKEDK
uniref:Uncharacterized protein n=1 Tax=Solanum tuberosum TaxID=4113 RepID=M1D6Y7_SOLTU